jgi:hypothetical protein
MCSVATGFFRGVQIAAVSYSGLGQPDDVASFLEMPYDSGGTCTAPTPWGQFTIPSRVIGGVTSSVTSASSSDASYDYPQSCGYTYNLGLNTHIVYLP